MTQPACVVASCGGSSGWPGTRSSCGGGSSGASAMIGRAASPSSSPPSAATMSARRARIGTASRSCRRADRACGAGVQRVDHLLRDVDARPSEHGLLQDQVVLLLFEDLSITLLARSTTAASSSFLRWFRSSWNSRRLRWNSRSCSTSSRWRRWRSASARVGASFSSLSDAAFSCWPPRPVPSRACRIRLRAWPARPSPASPRATRARCSRSRSSVPAPAAARRQTRPAPRRRAPGFHMFIRKQSRSGIGTSRFYRWAASQGRAPAHLRKGRPARSTAGRYRSTRGGCHW